MAAIAARLAKLEKAYRMAGIRKVLVAMNAGYDAPAIVAACERKEPIEAVMQLMNSLAPEHALQIRERLAKVPAVAAQRKPAGTDSR